MIKKQPSLNGAGVCFGGAWRIRTAVDGFADRRLSHSSKAPFLKCGCKGKHNSRYCQIFCSVFVAAARIFPFFITYLPFQVASAASFAGVVPVSEDLPHVPSCIGCRRRQDHNHHIYLPHNLLLQVLQFPQQQFVDHLDAVALAFDVLAYIINIIKEVAEGIEQEIGLA